MQTPNSPFVLGRVSQALALFLSQAVERGDTIIDATLGNGNDASLVLELVGEHGFLIGFDIQQEAIDQSRARLSRYNNSQYELILDSHHLMGNYTHGKPIKGVIFNLGYLPKADKTKTTLWHTTQIAVESACEIILPGGFIAITTYPGHETGAEENEALNCWLKDFDQKRFEVSRFEMLNQINHPPILYWISKKIPSHKR